MTFGILRVVLYERVAAECVKGNNMAAEIQLGNFEKMCKNRSLIFMRSAVCFDGSILDVAVITGTRI